MKTIHAAAHALQQAGFRTEVFPTGKRGDAEIKAREAASLKAGLIVAAGGDGTINEVINGMVWSDTPLAIIPLGTTNVLAREIFSGRGANAALEAMTAGAPRHVSLGKIDAVDSGRPVSRYFCLMAGIGFDGMVVRDVRLKVKRITGPGAYILSGLSTLFRHAPEELTFRIDGADYRGHLAVVGKISRYGGDFRVTPDARIGDPALYACIFQGGRRRDLLRYLFLVPFCRHLTAPDVLYLKASGIAISGSAPIQIDGDYFGSTPATISIARDALRLVC
ncbi:MAG: YegS/Rv2252/BmrU family lipid kinase [Nitrospiraceae bacterium]|nr:YegS/Rv2252/BmrU family lipid kinase [Nitrospiraceae bacterium]